MDEDEFPQERLLLDNDTELEPVSQGTAYENRVKIQLTKKNRLLDER
jgi:hypothetical protein